MVKLNQQKLPSLSESKLLHILHFLNFNLLLARFNVCTTKEKFNYFVIVLSPADKSRKKQRQFKSSGKFSESAIFRD